MNNFVKQYSKNIYSQFGEDGILEECLQRMKKRKGLCVEFGAADGYFCSNTMRLIEQGWKGLMYDINPNGSAVMQAYITPENINHHVPNCDVLSIDVDGNDYNIWKAYTGKPAIVVIEINSSIDPFASEPISDMKDGTAFSPMVELGLSKGYFLLCHTGNLIFVDKIYKILFPEISIKINVEKIFNWSWIKEAKSM